MKIETIIEPYMSVDCNLKRFNGRTPNRPALKQAKEFTSVNNTRSPSFDSNIMVINTNKEIWNKMLIQNVEEFVVTSYAEAA